jgi:hypothetical protein
VEELKKKIEEMEKEMAKEKEMAMEENMNEIRILMKQKRDEQQ